MKLKETLKILEWFFDKGRWWKIIMGMFLSGLLILILQEYLFSLWTVLGLFFGILIAFIDFISAYNEGFSVMQWILEQIE